jgi:hypothetical protein
MLPDLALIEVFAFYMAEAWIETWHTLVHVCRKWRNIGDGSPRRLDLRLFCTARTPVRETLDIWPPLPIVVNLYHDETWGVDNIVAALGPNDRVYEMGLFGIRSSQLEEVLAALQQPFPTLTLLRLGLKDEAVPVDPDLFLGGSAPRLQTLSLDHIPFPGLPKLLLSATHLVQLCLLGIPHSGYISPEAMATCLSGLTRLEYLEIEFESPQSRPDHWQNSRRPPLPTRNPLPVLTVLLFKGVSEYLEDLVVRIDALYSKPR